MLDISPKFKICILLLLLFGIVLLCACSTLPTLIVARKYDKEWIIGKTSSEIQERYGEFELILCDLCVNEDGNYCKTGCGYMTKKWSDIATAKDEFFMIYFDANGFAYEFKENYPRPGG